MTPWTEADDAKLQELVAEGLSASEIGSRLGRGRHSVIGRLHRAKGKLGTLQGSHASVPGAGRKKGSAPAKSPRVVIVAPARVAIPQPPVANLPATLPVPFLQAIERGRCLHFIGDPYSAGGPDMPVCGAERSQQDPLSRYCGRHERSSRGGVAA